MPDRATSLLTCGGCRLMCCRKLVGSVCSGVCCRCVISVTSFTPSSDASAVAGVNDAVGNCTVVPAV